MGFKAAASELGTEGGLRTRTDTDTVKAKSIRIRTYPYALETCLSGGHQVPRAGRAAPHELGNPVHTGGRGGTSR